MKMIVPIAIMIALPGTMTLSGSTSENVKTDEARTVSVSETYGKLPLSFEANNGQTDAQVKFLSRGSGYGLFLTNNEAVMAVAKPAKMSPAEAAAQRKPIEKSGARVRRVQSAVLRMKLVGANSGAKVTGQDQLPGKVNYFIGNDPERWRTNMETFAKVRYEQVYSGIDLVYYGNQRQLEYDFVVAPGADPTRIRLGFRGAKKMRVDAYGDLLVETIGGPVRWNKPVVYQEVGGVRKTIDGKYLLRRKHQVSFEVAAYDRGKALIIDPALAYSTYLGGSNDDEAAGIALDSSSNAYVTGFTFSANFPTTVGAFDTAFGGAGVDTFVSKLNANGASLLYSTYLGGSDSDASTAIVVDSMGNAYVTGQTVSVDFPTTTGAFQTAFGGGVGDAFITKLDPAGAALVYSTYLGGSDVDVGNGIAIDGVGNAYVAGATRSPNLGTINAFQPTYVGGADVFVAELNASGTALVYYTYLGGSNFEDGGTIAVDPTGNAYITGVTFSTDFPTANPIQGTKSADADAFVTKLNSTGSALAYSTYLGGSDTEFTPGIAVDSAGNAYIAGGTASHDFPTANAVQPTFTGPAAGFVTKLNATGSGFVYSTFFTGSAGGGGQRVAVDSSGNAYLAGATQSNDFPTINAIQTTNAGSLDAVVFKLDPSGSPLFSTYLGGSNSDDGRGIAVDGSGNMYVAGNTSSTNFPITSGAFQSTNHGGGGKD